MLLWGDDNLSCMCGMTSSRLSVTALVLGRETGLLDKAATCKSCQRGTPGDNAAGPGHC